MSDKKLAEKHFSHLYDNYVRNNDEPEHEERGIEIFKNIFKFYLNRIGFRVTSNTKSYGIWEECEYY